MPIELKVPVFPESVSDGTILNWNKKPGDAVKRDESIVDIETDKVVFEVPAPKDGVLEDIIEQAGAVVASGQLIGHMREGKAKDAATSPVQTVVAVPEEKEKAGEAFATPSARRLIEEHGLDIATIKGSGSGNRILKEDVLSVLQDAQPKQQPVAVTPPAETVKPQSAESLNPDGRTEKRVPMTRLRARIAERLLEAQQTAAILTTFNEINMQPVMDLRSRYKDRLTFSGAATCTGWVRRAAV